MGRAMKGLSKFVIVVTGVILLAATGAGAEPPPAAEPPSIEKVIVAAGTPSSIEGEGRPGNVVRLLSDGETLGEATVAANRRWRIVLKDGLKPGTYQIRAQALAGTLRAPVSGDEIRVSVPDAVASRAVVTYDGARGDESSDATRRRAEALAEAAGRAYDEVTAGGDAASPPPPPAAPPATGPPEPRPAGPDEAEGAGPPMIESPAAEGESARTDPLAVVVDWLKRSARAYRENIVEQLAVPAPDRPSAPEGPADEVARADVPAATASEEERPRVSEPEPENAEAITAAEAARRIAEERQRAEELRRQAAEADAARRKAEADKAAAENARKQEEARQRAEEFARRKAEADKRQAEELEALKKARAEADAKAAARAAAEKPVPPPDASPARPPQRVTITLEPFSLPGEEPPKTARDHESDDQAEAAADDADEPGPVRHAKPRRPPTASASRCMEGRVFRRKGRRWYITGHDDTLWDIAERFYGSGLAYPRIYRVNRSRLSSPHVVRPCLALRLPARGR
jgi:nucleoid-associated protein YgaU